MELVLAGVSDSSAVPVQIYPAVVWNDGQPIFYQRHVFVSRSKLTEPRFLTLLNTSINQFDSMPDGAQFKPYFQVAKQLRISQRDAMIFMAAASVAYPNKYELLAQPLTWSNKGSYATSLRMAVVGAKVYPMLRRK